MRTGTNLFQKKLEEKSRATVLLAHHANTPRTDGQTHSVTPQYNAIQFIFGNIFLHRLCNFDLANPVFHSILFNVRKIRPSLSSYLNV